MKEHVANWCEKHPLAPIHVDCATTVMLKNLDASKVSDNIDISARLKAEEKIIMALLYEQVKHLPGELFDKDFHELIDVARNNLTESMKEVIYEKRLLAETMLSRPVMKAFKAMIRQNGLFQVQQGAASP